MIYQFITTYHLTNTVLPRARRGNRATPRAPVRAMYAPHAYRIKLAPFTLPVGVASAPLANPAIMLVMSAAVTNAGERNQPP